MRGAGVRLELLRFSLLIVLTIGLLSVAFRIGSHSSSSSSSGPPHRPATPAPSPSASASPTVPVQVLPSSATRSPRHPQVPGGSAPTTTVAGTKQILPVTGWDDAVKLGALAFVLIGGGTLTVRAAGPRRQRPETVHD